MLHLREIFRIILIGGRASSVFATTTPGERASLVARASFSHDRHLPTTRRDRGEIIHRGNNESGSRLLLLFYSPSLSLFFLRFLFPLLHYLPSSPFSLFHHLSISVAIRNGASSPRTISPGGRAFARWRVKSSQCAKRDFPAAHSWRARAHV